jgi:hypothetical protein
MFSIVISIILFSYRIYSSKKHRFFFPKYICKICIRHVANYILFLNFGHVVYVTMLLARLQLLFYNKILLFSIKKKKTY